MTSLSKRSLGSGLAGGGAFRGRFMMWWPILGPSQVVLVSGLEFT
jgi:hypothetical protein